MNFKLKFEI